MNKPDRPYRVREALPMLGMGVTKFYALVAAGEIQAVKMGRSTFVSETEIMRFRATLPTLGRKPEAAALSASAA